MPSTTLPAAAPGLPSRRRALAVFASAGAVVGLPVAAQAIAGGTPGVAELAHRHALAHARHMAANDACEAAEARVAYSDPPEALFRQNADWSVFGGLAERHSSGRWWYGVLEIIDCLRDYRTENFTTADRAKARAAEIVAAWEAWRADRKTAQDAAGVTAANATFSDTYDELDAVRRCVISLRSTAPDALRLKVAVVLGCCTAAFVDHSIAVHLNEYGPDEDSIALSIVRDLIATQQVGA